MPFPFNLMCGLFNKLDKTRIKLSSNDKIQTLTHEQLLSSLISITKSFYDEAQKQLYFCYISFPNVDQIESSACKYDDWRRLSNEHNISN